MYEDLLADIQGRMLESLGYVIGMDPTRVGKQMC
jgi:hypothetical protein